jgi:hypothetical protein
MREGVPGCASEKETKKMTMHDKTYTWPFLPQDHQMVDLIKLSIPGCRNPEPAFEA